MFFKLKEIFSNLNINSNKTTNSNNTITTDSNNPITTINNYIVEKFKRKPKANTPTVNSTRDHILQLFDWQPEQFPTGFKGYTAKTLASGMDISGRLALLFDPDNSFNKGSYLVAYNRQPTQQFHELDDALQYLYTQWFNNIPEDQRTSILNNNEEYKKQQKRIQEYKTAFKTR